MPKPFKGKIELDVRDSVPDWDAFLPDKAPAGAPNVLVVLYDDTGLAAWSPFGGGIQMPTVSSRYAGSRFEFTGGEIVKVASDVADDGYVDVERHFASAMARD